MPNIIRAKAPTRIDLAGGTLDLWPLYLFFENTATINCAIDQFAEVTIDLDPQTKVAAASSIELKSLDRNESHLFKSYGELVESFAATHKAINLPSALWLHAKVVRHFFGFWRRTASFSLATQCASPAGAGLGGSSALNIALCSALRKLTQANYQDEELITLARDLETTVIEVPAGVQDYWSAMFGGIQAIRMEAGRTTRKVFYKQKSFIESHLILCYSGQSRNSGINNWAVYKKFIDKDQAIHSAFKEIVKATYWLEESLEAQDEAKLFQAIDKEWTSRQVLASTIATNEMLQIIAMAKTQGAQAAKVCGAGGGGCFLIAVPANKKATTTEYLRKHGVQVIDFKVVEEGCTIHE